MGQAIWAYFPTHSYLRVDLGGGGDQLRFLKFMPSQLDKSDCTGVALDCEISCAFKKKYIEVM